MMRYALIPLLLTLWAIDTPATTGELPVAKDIDAELDYLLGFVGTGRRDPGAISVDRLSRTLDFLVREKESGALYYAHPRNGAASAYLQLDLRRSLADVLRLTYDPHLPAAATSPSTVRTGRWTRLEPEAGGMARFWEALPPSGRPAVTTGVEHLVNTPDAHTGAYYEYDLDRSLILTRWRNRPLFISLSAQRGRSSVGRQGIILGADAHWTYLYSGVPGLNWPGFGWVDSYLYDSYSVAIFVGTSTGRAPTRFGIFKWVNAGWLGINMANPGHIHAGLKRYANAYQEILENAASSDVAAFVHRFARLRDWPEKQLLGLTEGYLNAIRKTLTRDPALDGARQTATLLAKGDYPRTLDKEDLVSIASIETLKALLGRPHQLPAGTLPAERTDAP